MRKRRVQRHSHSSVRPCVLRAESVQGREAILCAHLTLESITEAFRLIKDGLSNVICDYS